MRRFASLLLTSLAAALLPVTAAEAAPRDPYDLHFSWAWRVERFHSSLADSLGHSLHAGPTAALGFDFRVIDLPLGAAKPSIHVVGHTRTSGRTFATDGLAPASPSRPGIEDLGMLEMGAAVIVRIPVAMFAPGSGSDLYGGYEGGFGLASDAGYDFLRIKRGLFGFERTHGFFEGSRVEMTYGRNDSYGRLYSFHRWATRFHVESRITPLRKAAPGAKPGAATTSASSPLRAFVDLVVDTDGREGPDAIEAMFGVNVDAGVVLRRLLGGMD